MMKPLVSILLLLLAIAKTDAVGTVRRASKSTSVNNNGCPLCTCDDADPSTASDDTIEASVLMLDVQVSC